MKITIGISHTINIGDYESIKPEVSMEFDTDNEDVKNHYKTLATEWGECFKQHLERAKKIRSIKGGNTDILNSFLKRVNEIALVSQENKSQETQKLF